MQLDIATFMTASAFVAALGGVALLFAAWQYRSTPAAAIWGVSNLAAAGGVFLFSEGIRVTEAFFLVTLAAGLIWVAVSSFNRRPVRYIPLIAGALLWLLALRTFPLPWEVAAFQSVIVFFVFGSALEMWNGRTERLAARWPILALLIEHCAIIVYGVITTLTIPPSTVMEPNAFIWLVQIENIIFVVGTTAFLLAIIKERSVHEHRIAATIDSLTGLPNRGGFFVAARAVMAGAFARNVPVVGALFDLDLFKQVNDRFGHRVGDVVLQRFAQTVGRTLRRGDVVGRVGGEEFAVLMPGAGPEAGLALADRVRAAFAEEGKWVDGQPINATVSASLAQAKNGGSLEVVLDAADQALYAAKAKGRNRVQLHDDGVRSDDPVVVRFA